MVDREYLDKLREDCVKERKAKNKRVEDARKRYGLNHEFLKDAAGMPLPSCNLYDQMRNSAPVGKGGPGKGKL